MQRITIIAAFILLIAAGSCGHGRKLISTIDNPPGVFAQPQASQPVVEWPAGLPVDKAQPWEKLDGAGRVVSSINLQSEFIPGVERFLEAGSVSDLGEASAFTSGSPGGEGVSWAIYRIPMGADQPGTIACDANTRLNANSEPSAYYIGVGDYSVNTWHWYGPFAVSHVRFNVPPAAYTSALGNLMLAVVAYDGADFDLVGLGVNAYDSADTTPPPALADAPWVTPYNGMVLVEWPQVVASDLAGYRVFINGDDALGYLEGGTDVAVPTDDVVDVTVSAVDISGNESAPSPVTTQGMPAGTPPACQLAASSASGMRGDVISLTASGGDTYDWDTDGDGTWDMVGVTDTTAFANTVNMGIIRPRIYAHTAGGGFWMGAVSLVIAGNSRPLANGYANPSSGPAPLSVDFSGEGVDLDGTIAEYAWDFDGGGYYDYTDPNSAIPPTQSFPNPGLYNAKFRVTDNDGAWDVDTISIYVEGGLNHAPVPYLTAWPEDVYIGISNDSEMVNLSAATSYDIDGDSLLYSFDSIGLGGWAPYIPDSTYDAWINFEPGSYHPRVRVRDEHGLESETSTTVNVYRFQMGEASTYLGNAVGRWPSMCNSGGMPAIAHYDFTNDDLMFTMAVSLPATSEDDWITYPIDTVGAVGGYQSMCASMVGNPFIAYYDQTNTSLKFASADTYTPAGAVDWTLHTVDNSASVGTFPAITTFLTNNPPEYYTVIAYYDTTNTSLKVAISTIMTPSAPGDWNVYTIDNAASVGGFPSITTVYKGLGGSEDYYVGIAYYDSTNGDLKYAYSNTWPASSALDWDIQIVDDGAGNNVGAVSSITPACAEGLPPIIAHYDVTATKLKIAVGLVLEPLGPADWTTYTLNDTGTFGIANCIARANNGELYVLYNETTYDRMKIAHAKSPSPLSPDDWYIHTFANANDTGIAGSMDAMFLNGKLIIAYPRMPYEPCLMVGWPVPY